MKLRVKEVCKEKGLTLVDVATKMGIAQSNLSGMLNGNPTIGTLGKVADVLGVPISDLFEQPASDVIICPKCGTKFKMEEQTWNCP
ncbi:MAG: helix-turn-helix transcriptional regulator [Prevotellaceae bacterium]|jgi:transcriptional regulator with XRE-family HTH domain|nr:helix-turn-helix transcriptional regulator [Prevotellaceae bacterium]